MDEKPDQRREPPKPEHKDERPTNVVRLPPPRYRVEDTNPGD
jgi:hypothetical protein